MATGISNHVESGIVLTPKVSAPLLVTECISLQSLKSNFAYILDLKNPATFGGSKETVYGRPPLPGPTPAVVCTLSVALCTGTDTVFCDADIVPDDANAGVFAAEAAEYAPLPLAL